MKIRLDSMDLDEPDFVEKSSLEKSSMNCLKNRGKGIRNPSHWHKKLRRPPEFQI